MTTRAAAYASIGSYPCPCAADDGVWVSLYLHHRDTRSPQVASESGPIAARSFHTGAAHGTEAIRPAEEFLIALRGGRHTQLSQTSAHLVQGHRHVHVLVCVDTQDHLIHGSRTLVGSDRHVRSPLGVALSSLP